MEKINDDVYSFDFEEAREIINKIIELTKTDLPKEAISKMVTEIKYITDKTDSTTEKLFDGFIEMYSPQSVLFAQTSMINRVLYRLAVGLTATTLALCSSHNLSVEKTQELIEGLKDSFFKSIDVTVDRLKESRTFEFDDQEKEFYELVKNKK